MKITYKLFAHTSPESSVDNFEKACADADYMPYEQEKAMAKYVGSEIELTVTFDTELKSFEVTF